MTVERKPRVIVRSAAEVRGELEAICAEWPQLRDISRECCGGCASQFAAQLYGWGPATDAWERVDELRYLLGEDR